MRLSFHSCAVLLQGLAIRFLFAPDLMELTGHILGTNLPIGRVSISCFLVFSLTIPDVLA